MQINLHGLKRNAMISFQLLNKKNKFGRSAPAIEFCVFDTKIGGSPLILFAQVDGYIINNCSRT